MNLTERELAAKLRLHEVIASFPHLWRNSAGSVCITQRARCRRVCEEMDSLSISHVDVKHD